MRKKFQISSKYKPAGDQPKDKHEDQKQTQELWQRSFFHGRSVLSTILHFYYSKYGNRCQGLA